jgi:hypothetical protein
VALCGKNLLRFDAFLFGCVVRGLVKSITCITLDRKVLEWIERKVEEGVFASRSHAVEYAVRQLMRRDGKPDIIS